MAFNLTDYIPHAAIAGFATVVAYVFKAHDERDDARFTRVGDGLIEMNRKLDAALATQATNHAEVLKLLLDATKERRDNFRDR